MYSSISKIKAKVKSSVSRVIIVVGIKKKLIFRPRYKSILTKLKILYLCLC